MHRLFVALRPPPDIRALLIAAMGGVRAARWQNDEQLHLTLRFIGEVDRPIAEDVVAALGSVHAPPITAAIAGVGRFEKRGRTDAIWAGVAPGDALAALHAKVHRAPVPLGLAPERRAKLPQLTIDRLDRARHRAPGGEHFPPDHAGPPPPPLY